jgi:hypothetical protein
MIFCIFSYFFLFFPHLFFAPHHCQSARRRPGLLLQVGAEGHRRPSAGGREALGAIASRPVASGWRQSRGMVASWWRRPRGGGRRRFGGGGNRRSSCRVQQELFCVLLTVPRGARREGKGKHPIKKIHSSG